LENSEVEVTTYQPEYALEIVKMWRQYFQRAMGLEEQNRFDELRGQLEFFKTIDPASIEVAMDRSSSTVVAFMVRNRNELDHLYVHVDWQGRGIGSLLLDRAKARSPGCLELYTFQQNKLAHAFYLSKGFHEVGRGVADFADNPWATTREQIADIKYRWEV
jgi:GNAT superfamily N-acetyltransferase